MSEDTELPLIDTSQQDWASDYLKTANEIDQLTLPASITSKELAKYVTSGNRPKWH